MMNYMHKKHILIILLLCSFQFVNAQDIHCRPYSIVKTDFDGPDKFRNGLLWRVSRGGIQTGYIFGTIHVDDSEILDLPELVLSALNGSEFFVMEAVPSAKDAMEFSMSMFFMDGNRLDKLLPETLFNRTVSILERYSLTREMVSVMKPWAAYIIMSYPENMGMVLDLYLLQLAQRNGTQISGLETSSEQISIFSDMELDEQVRILADTVCHYETLAADFTALKKLYKERDLEALYIYSQQYSFDNDSIYEEISERLISERNARMVERMIGILDSSTAFIAVGAMHLPGENGILNLLEQNDYEITRIY